MENDRLPGMWMLTGIFVGVTNDDTGWSSERNSVLAICSKHHYLNELVKRSAG